MRVSILQKKEWIVAAVLAAGTLGAMAQGTTGTAAITGTTATTATATTKTAGADALPRGDRKFVMEAATGGMAEVEMGKLAQQKATNDQVKQYAARMVTDHSKANDELKSIVGAKNVALPADMPKRHHRDAEKMNKMAGADFDRAYMKHMVADHKKTVSLFERQAKSGNDAELKGFAAKTLPTLQEHLQMAQALEASVKK